MTMVIYIFVYNKVLFLPDVVSEFSIIQVELLNFDLTSSCQNLLDYSITCINMTELFIGFILFSFIPIIHQTAHKQNNK